MRHLWASRMQASTCRYNQTLIKPARESGHGRMSACVVLYMFYTSRLCNGRLLVRF